MSLVLVVLAGGCAESAAPTDDIAWAGWVYVDQDEERVLTDGTVSFWEEGAAEATLAVEPYPDDYPGYWEVALPPGVPVNVRLAEVSARTTWWAGDAPTSRGNWFGGALFAVTDTWLLDVLDALGEDEESWLAEAAGKVIVLGQPVTEGILCGELAVGLADDLVQPSCFSTDEAGAITPAAAEEGVSWFIGVSEPGEVLVTVGGAEERWTAAADEVILPWYLVGGGE